MRPVATASAVTDNVSHPPAVTGHGPVTRPNTVQVGTIVWLASELMFFAGVFAMYFQIRSASTALWADQTAKLNVPFAAINCLVLVISSVWCQMGVWKAERLQPGRTGSLLQVSSWGMREWYVLTYIFGAAFIAGQVYEYAKLVSEGVTLSSDQYGSIFFFSTGFHALHVSGGLVAFLLIIARTFTSRRYDHKQAVGAVVTSYYWHFVDVVWIALFSTIYLLR
ncbi:MAG: heme-copper oxidase subunit III [Candidatus Lutibacillus vidarii]|nr:heme-copper oxidase subunit III [Candidatus Lutibacillus vidarii]HON74304.1 heme-copper oxidase subunit III [Dermatophilaceae bacterium]HRC18891.1 heme-copper oxidase subunit III [Phycicoccus elongatus]